MNARRTGVLLTSLALVLFSASASLAKEKHAPGDPPGNNGTIKVVASDPSDPDPGNEPHLDTCLLWLEFYGFDQGQTADITFRAHPPTGDGELLAHKAVPISEDAAGGGQDQDAVLGYNLASALQQYEPHPQQGYHVKVTSDAKEAPGGPKQKVFWLKCAPAPTGSLKLTKAVEGGSGGPFKFLVECNHSPLDRELTLTVETPATIPDVPGGTTCVVTETDMGGATSNRFTETPPHGAADGTVVVPGGGTTDVLVTNVFGQPPAVQPAGTSDDAGAEGAQVAGVSETRTPGEPAAAQPGAEVAGVSEVAGATTTLPRTGTSPRPLVGAAAALLASGLVLLTGARRRGATG
jgi:hypothetical protein